MKVWRDKEGRWVDAKEFKQRFAAGVQKVTPLQQTKSQIFFTYITMIGLLCGLIVSIWKISSLWWLGIILLAGLGNTTVGLVGLIQKRNQLEHIDKIMKGEEVNNGF